MCALLPASGGSVNAVLTVNCELPGGDPTIVEGVTLTAGSLHFVQKEGATLFHILED